MATTLEIPLLTTTSTFEVSVILDGVGYAIRCQFNTRSRYWYMSIFDANGALLFAGKKMTSDRPLLQRETSDLLPPGDLWLYDTEGLGADPGLRDLGKRHALLYVESE